MIGDYSPRIYNPCVYANLTHIVPDLMSDFVDIGNTVYTDGLYKFSERMHPRLSPKR